MIFYHRAYKLITCEEMLTVQRKHGRENQETKEKICCNEGKIKVDSRTCNVGTPPVWYAGVSRNMSESEKEHSRGNAGAIAANRDGCFTIHIRDTVEGALSGCITRAQLPSYGTQDSCTPDVKN